MELKNTVALMNSEYYKERFIAEYIQTKIRYEKLKTFNQRIEVAKLTGVEEPKHDCPLDLLKQQQSVMGEYLHILELRAKIEHINLTAALSRLEVSTKPVDITGGTYKPSLSDININPCTISVTSSGDTDGDNIVVGLSGSSVLETGSEVESKPKRKYIKSEVSE